MPLGLVKQLEGRGQRSSCPKLMGRWVGDVGRACPGPLVPSIDSLTSASRSVLPVSLLLPRLYKSRMLPGRGFSRV